MLCWLYCFYQWIQHGYHKNIHCIGKWIMVINNFKMWKIPNFYNSQARGNFLSPKNWPYIVWSIMEFRTTRWKVEPSNLSVYCNSFVFLINVEPSLIYYWSWWGISVIVQNQRVFYWCHFCTDICCIMIVKVKVSPLQAMKLPVLIFIGGWVDHRTSLDTNKWRKISTPLQCPGSNLDHPAHS